MMRRAVVAWMDDEAFYFATNCAGICFNGVGVLEVENYFESVLVSAEII